MVSLDYAVQTKDVTTASNTPNAQPASNFNDSLKNATDSQVTSEIATTNTKLEDTTKLSGVDKEKVEKEEESTSLTLEFLLPTAKVEELTNTDITFDLAGLFNATSIEELISITGGKFDEKSLSDQNLNLKNVSEALGISENDLQQLFTKLTGQKTESTDLWNGLNTIDGKLSQVLSKISATLNGASNTTLTKKDAQTAVALFKLVDLAAPKTDLVLKQELQSSQMKDWLSTIASSITTKTTEKTVTLPFGIKQFNFKPVGNDTTQTTTQQLTPPTTVAKSPAITITLPASPQGQASKFVEEFQSIMNRAQVANNAAGTRLLIKLYPENLGTIRVELVEKNGVLSAKLLASTALGKQMLDSSLHQLKQGLVNQNIQLDRIDVAQALSEPSKGEKGHQFGQQTPNQNTSKDEDETKKADKVISFEEIMAEMEE